MREYISARYLLAAPPPKTVVIPDTFPIERYSAKVAYGARKPRGGCVAGAATTSKISEQADRRVIKSLAYNGWR
jgi:hypothetical protein